MTKRAFEFLQEIEQSRHDKVALEVNIADKCIKYHGGLVGYSVRGEWYWAHWALERYSDEQRAMAASYAQSE